MHDQDTPGTADTSAGAGSSASTEAGDGTLTRLPDDSGREGSTPPASGSSGILAQLQQLIAQVAAAPVTRDVAAKAAELAALAAEKAGPAARSLATRTEEVSQSVAERAMTFASSMRNDESASAEATGGSAAGGPSGT